MMNNAEPPRPSLLLRVNNSNQLQSGCDASHTFGPEGGRVGSGVQNDWRIQDSDSVVAAEHFSIVWRDGAFCLHTSDATLQLNHAPVETRIGLIKLQQGDEIALGQLVLSVLVSLNGGALHDPMRTTPESLVTDHSNPLESLLERGHKHDGHDIAPPVLEPTVASAWSSDPLQALQNESITQPGMGTTADEALLSQEAPRVQAKTDYPDNARDYAMDQEVMELPNLPNRRARADDAGREEMSQRYVAVTPIMRGLEAPLTLHDSEQANALLEEIGRTLQATIRGLLALQRQQDALSDKHLRPLEDNPLRLNMDYDTTLNVLFADGKSPVHLSAPEAVAESLHNMRLHYQANRHAITEALSVMLEAFSPPRLMARFAQYRRSSERGDMSADWAWNMYCSYYEELASRRQQGFEKLFNEVYEQAYDRALRQGQRERGE